MKKFVANERGGVDICLEDGEILFRLTENDVKGIIAVQQRQNDLDFVKHQVWNWVEKQLEDDDGFFADFNSHLFSGDEISQEEIWQKLLSDEVLIQKIADEYREILEDPASEDGPEWWIAEEAISTHTSIKDIMGEILCDKYHKELLVGSWRVLVIEKGDLYGKENRVPWHDEEPLVEFYDMRADKEKYPEGQFTTGRFYIHRLFNPGFFDESIEDMAEQGKSFSWHQNRPEWTVKPGELNVISAWLKAVYAKVQDKVKVSDLIAGASARVCDSMVNGKEQDYFKN